MKAKTESNRVPTDRKFASEIVKVFAREPSARKIDT